MAVDQDARQLDARMTDADAALDTDAALTEAAGLYGPDSEAWRLNREALLLLGAGPRALLLQIAHPLVAEGVDQHSGFREDPWSRLASTTRSYLRIVYGSASQARGEIRRLNALHRSIAGPVNDPLAAARHGSSYEARDPELSLWVHATLVDSTIVAFDRWLEPLSRDQRRRYYVETKPIARAFGVPPSLLPRDLDAFEAYIEGMLAPEGPVHPTPTAIELSRSILHPSLAPLALQEPIAQLLGPAAEPVSRILGVIPPRVYDWQLLPALDLLPPTTRREYGLEMGRAQHLVATWLRTGWLRWRPWLPPSFREFTIARAADRRVARQ
jgi:uncharacterized protein (DUF2236 family)